MRRLSVLIVLFVGFSVMNGYGSGIWDKNKPAPAPAPIPGVDELTKNVGDLTKNIGELTKNVSELKERVVDLERNPRQDSNQDKPAPAGEPQFIPISLAIINKQRENLGELDYFVSQNISLTIPGSEKNSIIVQNRILEEIPEERRSEDKFEISKNDPGKILKFSPTPTGRESMEILFSDKSANLTFTRNRNKDVFELASARKDGKEINLDDKDKTVQLYVKYKGNPLTLTTNKTEAESGQQERPAPTARRSSPPAIPRNILLERGQGYLTQDAVVDYMQKHNRSSWFNRRDISALVNAYFQIAKEEGVNHEIALAQMWYATRELSNNVLLRNCNYAGLEAVKRGRFNGRFNNRDAGVRAHIQHLKGYASTVRPRNIVDPRYEILVTNGYLGKADTLEKLSVFWLQDKEYEANIIRILRDLYLYQYQFNSRG